MGIVRTEPYKNDEGIEMVKEIYANGTVVDRPVEVAEDLVEERMPTIAEIYENQLIIMEALADLYAGGVENG